MDTSFGNRYELNADGISTLSADTTKHIFLKQTEAPKPQRTVVCTVNHRPTFYGNVTDWVNLQTQKIVEYLSDSNNFGGHGGLNIINRV